MAIVIMVWSRKIVLTEEYRMDWVRGVLMSSRNVRGQLQ